MSSQLVSPLLHCVASMTARQGKRSDGVHDIVQGRDAR